MSRRRVQVVLLCEDKQHEAFGRRFLSRRGFDDRKVRVERLGVPRGSAEQYVRSRYVVELEAQRRSHVSRDLVVLVDGDRLGTADRLRQLESACVETGVEPRESTDRAAIFVPTFNIESWLAYLDGEESMSRPNYPRLKPERKCRRHVEILIRMCDDGELRSPAPRSLEAACAEYNRRMAS